MGIDANGARFLAFARSVGVNYATVATIGRQSLYLSPAELRLIAADYGTPLGEDEAAEICERAGGFSDALFKYLGADEPQSFDYSDYEQPTHIHDMNLPIPERFKQSYGAVLDGGSLEHIFNFPTAIRNCMEMVAPGGHYLAITPANNFFGHGFYQFSPELYFTVLSPENGFEMVEMIAFEECSKPVWYRVTSPREIGGRVTLTNRHPVYLLVIARRIESKPIFATVPQQSDYKLVWGDVRDAVVAPDSPETARPLAIRLAKRVLPAPLRAGLRAIERLLPRARPLAFDPRYFRPMP